MTTAMGSRVGNSSGLRVLSAALWAIVVIAGAYLTYARFMDAVTSDIGTDLGVFFEASRHAAQGESVYLEPKYVYSPLVAWALLPLTDFTTVVWVWTALSLLACWGAVASVVAVLWRRLSAWQRPVVAGVAIITLLFNNVTSVYLWFGQTDTLVLFFAAFAVLMSARGWYAASGATLAVNGIMKTWPGGLALWYLRRGAPHRWRSLLTAAATALAFALIVVVISGPQTIVSWVERTLAFSSQPLVAYSVWGFGKQVFSDSGVMTPLWNAPILGTTVAWVLALAVIGLLVFALMRPGSDSLAMWHVASALVLLIPVSHVSYRLLMLPLLWVWTAYALSDRRRWPAVVMALVLACFWVITFRGQTLDNRFAADSTYYVVVMVSALVVFAASVIVGAARDSSARTSESTPAL